MLIKNVRSGLSLRKLLGICYIRGSHHPGKFERNRRSLRGLASEERVNSMGNDRDYGDSVSTKLTFFLVGAGIGAVLALLFAPKSGEELRNDIADATRKGIDRSREAAEQLGAKATEYYDATRAKAGEVYDSARETAGEYYEATRERATELYDTATTKAGEVASAARGAAVRQASSVQAAVEAGKKAYVEEKRKTELSGRTEASPTYKPEKAM